MSNIVTGRQLRAARILAGLTQRQLAKAVGVHERAARYWELKETKPLHRHRARSKRSKRCCVITVCSYLQTPTAGVRLTTDVAAQRVIRD